MTEKDLISRAISPQMPDLVQTREKCISQPPHGNTSRGKYVVAAAVCLIAAFGLSASVVIIKSGHNDVMPFVSKTDFGIPMSIFINDLEETGMLQIDADLKKIDASVKNGPSIKNGQPDTWDFDFLNRIKIPKQLTEVSYSEIYTRPLSDTKEEYLQSEYTILHDYVVTYTCTNSDNIVEKQVRLSFSKESEPLRDYYFGDEVKPSTIGDTTLKICRYEDSYMAVFSYQGLNFDVETYGITEQDFISILASVINE